MNMDNKNLADLKQRVEKLMKERYLRKTDVAKLLGIGYSTLWRILNGERRMKVEILCKLANILGTTPAFLLGDTDNSEYIKDIPEAIDSGNIKIDNYLINYDYWINLLHEIRKVLERGNINEISSVKQFVNMGYEMITLYEKNSCE